MGMSALNPRMPLQRHRQRRRRRIRARCGFTTTAGKRKGSPNQQDDDGESKPLKISKSSPNQQDDYGESKPLKISKSSIEDLSEDILCRIHSLLPMREAAGAACVSPAFLRSWRCYPNLIFNKDTIGLKKNGRGENFHHKIDRILRKHSGISLKTFRLDYTGMIGFNGNSYFDSWLEIALKLGIEELTLLLTRTEKQYNFPCSLLSDGVRNSLQCLELRSAAFHPTVELGPLGSLTRLHLSNVNITWDELKSLLCNSLALEQLELKCCKEIIHLKIPCALLRLSSLSVSGCERVKVIESKAPNLSCLSLDGHRLNFSLVETLQMKKLVIFHSNFVHYARVKLPTFMPNLETLDITSLVEVVDAPMLPTKFLNLKHLNIWLSSGDNSRLYDYLSLVSYLDASPSLETLVLAVDQTNMMHESVFVDSQLRDMPDRCHGNLQSVKIRGFSSAKCMVELACYILKNALSLKCLTLDTFCGPRCGQQKYEHCHPIANGVLMEAPRALSAIRTYIENKVPSTVKLTVLEPCSRCHATGFIF